MFTGIRTPNYRLLKKTLKNQLIQALDNGMTWLISGGELGTEQWGLEVGIALKADYPDLQTSLMTPFTDFGSRWQEDNQDKLSALKAQVDFTASVSQAPYQNRHSSVAICNSCSSTRTARYCCMIPK